jgi:hypothetical protein
MGGLNAAIKSAVAAGKLSSTVFVLEASGYYVLPEEVTVPAGTRLTIVAPEPGRTQQTAPPQIVFADNLDEGMGRISFHCFGDIVLRNVWLLYATTRGEQAYASLLVEDSPDTIKGQLGILDGVIFDYAGIGYHGSGAVSVTARHFKGTFRNCYFRNCTDRHFRYYGRAVSFPYNTSGWHTDNIQFENCTFANMGYVYNQEGGEYGDNVHFNHCTFFNILMYPLESGWWHKTSVTNSIFANTWMMGHIPAMSGMTDPEGGTIRIDSIARFGFDVPFTENERRILFANNSYYIEAWLRDWMFGNPMSVDYRQRGILDQVPVPQPMLSPGTLKFFDAKEDRKKVFPYMNRANLYDSCDPGFLVPPTNLLGLKTFLYMKWWCCSDTVWAYFPEWSVFGKWPYRENLAYSHPQLLTAAMGGFPLGDLYHWYPEEYSRWVAQEGSEHARLDAWLQTGSDPGSTDGIREQGGEAHPGEFVLCQNYPNPFNPMTVISYSIPSLKGRDGQLPVTGWVKLVVYDLLGREVARLVDEAKAPGAYSETWDASGMASGMYVYRLAAGSFSASKTMLLMK